MSGDPNPNWSEFTSALSAQRADFSDMFTELKTDFKNEFTALKQELNRNTEKMEEWVKGLKADADREHGEMKEDMREEIKRLDGRINVLTGVGISAILIFISAIVGLIMDMLKIKIFP